MEKEEVIIWSGIKEKFTLKENFSLKELSEDYLMDFLEDFIRDRMEGNYKIFKITDLKGNIFVSGDVSYIQGHYSITIYNKNGVMLSSSLDLTDFFYSSINIEEPKKEKKPNKKEINQIG